MNSEMTKSPGMSRQMELITQHEMQQRLDGFFDGSLLPVLSELTAWSEKIGYFDHLKEKNLYFEFPSDLGTSLRLQVNYSRLGYKKPEDPNAPSCPLCIENIGIKGKEKLRVFEFSIGERPVFIHLTPFPLHPGHYVLNNRTHTPMCIDGNAFELAYGFLQLAPGFLAASNSDVEWAGASVLQHHHLQVFENLELPIENAIEASGTMKDGLLTSVLHWPCPAIRLSGPPHQVLHHAGEYLQSWKEADPGRSTCNFLMRLKGENLEITLILRHPYYRSGEKLQLIKAEGVGIIEVCGEAIIPPKQALSREENQSYFQENGLSIVRAIIEENGPRPAWLTIQWLQEFVINPNAAICKKTFPFGVKEKS